MALDLGTLTAYIEINDKAFDRGISGALDKLKNFASSGPGIVAAGGAAIASAFGASLVGNMNVEAANDKLSAQLGLTESESERIGDVAGSLYAGAWGDSMEHVNVAVGAVMSSIDGMTNASSKRLEETTATALDFATAFEVDVQRAVQVAGVAMNSGLAENATQAFDLITAASQRVPAHLREDVLDAVEEYGKHFDGLGLSGQQAFALLVQGAEQGTFGIDKTGDAIAEFTKLVTGDMARTKPVIEELGMNYGATANAILAGGDKAQAATQNIVKGLLSIKDPAKQTRLSLELFGTPLEDLGTDKVPQFLGALSGGSSAMAGFEGAAERMGDALNDNATTNLTSFKRQAEQAFLSLAEKGLPIANEVAAFLAESFGPALDTVATILSTGLGPAISQVTSFLTEHDTTSKVIAGTITGVLIVALTAWGTAATISAYKNVTAWVSTALASQTSAPAQARSAAQVAFAWAMMGAKAMANGVRMAAAWLVAMGPVGIVIAIVAGLVILIVKNWDKIKRYTAKAWSWVVDKITGAWSKIVSGTKAIGGQVVSWVKALPGLLVSFFLNWTLAGLIIKHWDKVKSGSIRVATSLVEWVKGLPGRIVEGVGNLGTLLYDKGVAVVQGLWDGIKSMGSWLRDQLIGFVKDKIPGPIAKALGISSPSRVMRDLAVHIPEGLALGIDDGTARVEAASRRMAAATIPDIDAPGSGAGGPGGRGGRPPAQIVQNFPTTATPEAAAAAAGGRVVDALDLVGVG